MKRLLIIAVPLMAALACTVSTPTPAAPEQTAAATDAVIPPAASDTAGGDPSETETAAVTLPPEGMRAVWVYFTMAGDVNMTPVPAPRTVPDSDDPVGLVTSTLNELLAGPNDAERDAGLASWFSPATAGVLTGVTAGGGVFTADFAGLNVLIPNASTSAGSLMLLSQLNSTMFQFDFVQTAEYTLDGGCAAFWEWLQSGCRSVTRAEWEAG
jgi:hypothetical protein